MFRPLIVLTILLSTSAHAASAEVASATDATTKKQSLQVEPFPPRVDLRPDLTKWGLTPRHQARRNTCSVFATTGVLEFACSKHFQRGTRFSVEYLNCACNQIINNHSQDRGQFFRDLLKGFAEHGICPENEMPYHRKFDPAVEPSAQAIESAERIRDLGLKVHWIKQWRRTVGLSDRYLYEIKVVLAKGYPVAAGASHSRLIIGYEDDPGQSGGGVFFVQDSGIGKETTITYQFAKDNLNDLFWVEAP